MGILKDRGPFRFGIVVLNDGQVVISDKDGERLCSVGGANGSWDSPDTETAQAVLDALNAAIGQ